MRVEDFEIYYRKQKADSSCGFAEEFEVKNKCYLYWFLVGGSGGAEAIEDEPVTGRLPV